MVVGGTVGRIPRILGHGRVWEAGKPKRRGLTSGDSPWRPESKPEEEAEALFVEMDEMAMLGSSKETSDSDDNPWRGDTRGGRGCTAA